MFMNRQSQYATTIKGVETPKMKSDGNRLRRVCYGLKNEYRPYLGRVDHAPRIHQPKAMLMAVMKAGCIPRPLRLILVDLSKYIRITLYARLVFFLSKRM